MTSNFAEGIVDISEPIKRHKTLTEQAADAIRARIISGDLQFGAALSEIALAADLGVSKTPVREAFLQLKNEGLVDIQPQRGTFVFQMSLEELRQLVDMRELLETASLRRAMSRGDGLGAALAAIIDRMAVTVGEKHHVAYRQLDGEFHHAIITASHNTFVDSAYNIIAFRVQALRNRLSRDAYNWRSFDEHRDLADSIQRQDCDGAAKKLVEHLRTAFNDYLTRMEGALALTG